MPPRKGIHISGNYAAPHILYITCLDHICTLYFFLNERSDKIIFYILFKTQRPSDTVFKFRVKSNSSRRLYIRIEF